MASKDLHNNIRHTLAHTMVDITVDGTLNGLVKDTAGTEAVEFLCFAGVVAGAGVVTAVLLESDDPTFTTSNVVATDDILGTLSTFNQSEPDTVKNFGYIGHKRYLRLDYSATGVSGGTFRVGAQLVEHWLHHAPVN